MSGICGWSGYQVENTQQHSVINGMASKLARFDVSKIKSQHLADMGLAIAAAPGWDDLAEENDILVAVEGHPRWTHPQWNQQLKEKGIAAVCLTAFRQMGTKLLQYLEGSFSIAILQPGRALLAIDHIGIRPLLYYQKENTLVFASSPTALLAHPVTERNVDPQGIFNYLYFHVIPGPDSIFSGLRRLLPGHYVLFENGHAEIRPYCQLQYRADYTTPLKELRAEFRQLLRDSVRDAASDSEVGCFLSGGTDSSTVAGMLTKLHGEPVRTYSIGFDAKGYDEMEYARLAAHHFNTDHHEYYVTPEDVVDAIPRIAQVHDQPFGNSSAIPAYYCARLAKEDGVTLLLGGDGGDELFGGNERYAKQMVFGYYDRIPATLRHNLLEPFLFNLPGSHSLFPFNKLRSYVEQAREPLPGRMQTYNLLNRLGVEQILLPEFLGQVDIDRPLALQEAIYHNVQADSILNRILALDSKFTLTDNDLPKVTQACELVGLQVAFPLLDDRLIAFAARLPEKQKVRGQTLRYFFKEALRGFLPDEIIQKKKHGFGLPFGIWMTQHPGLREITMDSLNDLKRRSIIHPKFINTLMTTYLPQHPSYYGTLAWVLLMLEQWFRIHIDARTN